MLHFPNFFQQNMAPNDESYVIHYFGKCVIISWDCDTHHLGTIFWRNILGIVAFLLFVTEPKHSFPRLETYPHWAKYTTQTSKKKPCRNCHPKVCTKAEKSIENNPETVIPQAKGLKWEILSEICRTASMSINYKIGNSWWAVLTT